MKVGTKAQGQDHRAKLVSIRHGHAPRRSCNAQEKAIETKVRQAGKKECKGATMSENTWDLEEGFADGEALGERKSSAGLRITWTYEKWGQSFLFPDGSIRFVARIGGTDLAAERLGRLKVQVRGVAIAEGFPEECVEFHDSSDLLGWADKVKSSVLQARVFAPGTGDGGPMHKRLASAVGGALRRGLDLVTADLRGVR